MFHILCTNQGDVAQLNNGIAKLYAVAVDFQRSYMDFPICFFNHWTLPSLFMQNE